MIKSDPESPIIVPFYANEFVPSATEALLFERMRRYFYFRDLFAFQSPLKKDLYFFGRSDLIQDLMNRGRSGENTGVFGLRRSGKTSVIYGLQRALAPSIIDISIWTASRPLYIVVDGTICLNTLSKK